MILILIMLLCAGHVCSQDQELAAGRVRPTGGHDQDHEQDYSDSRNEIGKRDLQKFHEAFDAPRNAAVQRADPLGGECAQIDPQEMTDQPRRHLAFDPRVRARGEPAAEKLERFFQDIVTAEEREGAEDEIAEQDRLIGQFQDAIEEIAKQNRDLDLDVGDDAGDDDAEREPELVRATQNFPN